MPGLIPTDEETGELHMGACDGSGLSPASLTGSHLGERSAEEGKKSCHRQESCLIKGDDRARGM